MKMTETANKLPVLVRCVTEYDLPIYSTIGSAGADLKARISRIDRQDVTKNIKNGFITADDSILLYPGGRCLVPTGLFIQLPVGYEAQIRPRSGLALKKGLTVLNTPGTIDAE